MTRIIFTKNSKQAINRQLSRDKVQCTFCPITFNLSTHLTLKLKAYYKHFIFDVIMESWPLKLNDPIISRHNAYRYHLEPLLQYGPGGCRQSQRSTAAH